MAVRWKFIVYSFTAVLGLFIHSFIIHSFNGLYTQWVKPVEVRHTRTFCWRRTRFLLPTDDRLEAVKSSFIRHH